MLCQQSHLWPDKGRHRIDQVSGGFWGRIEDWAQLWAGMLPRVGEAWQWDSREEGHGSATPHLSILPPRGTVGGW